MKKRLKKKQYPSSCNKCDVYPIIKNLITNNGCGKCPNRDKVFKVECFDCGNREFIEFGLEGKRCSLCDGRLIPS